MMAVPVRETNIIHGRSIHPDILHTQKAIASAAISGMITSGLLRSMDTLTIINTNNIAMKYDKNSERVITISPLLLSRTTYHFPRK